MHSQTWPPLARWAKQTKTKHPLSLHTNFPGAPAHQGVSTGPAKLKAFKSIRNWAPVLTDLTFHLKKTDLILTKFVIASMKTQPSATKATPLTHQVHEHHPYPTVPSSNPLHLAALPWVYLEDCTACLEQIQQENWWELLPRKTRNLLKAETPVESWHQEIQNVWHSLIPLLSPSFANAYEHPPIAKLCARHWTRWTWSLPVWSSHPGEGN